MKELKPHRLANSRSDMGDCRALLLEIGAWDVLTGVLQTCLVTFRRGTETFNGLEVALGETEEE